MLPLGHDKVTRGVLFITDSRTACENDVSEGHMTRWVGLKKPNYEVQKKRKALQSEKGEVTSVCLFSLQTEPAGEYVSEARKSFGVCPAPDIMLSV